MNIWQMTSPQNISIDFYQKHIHYKFFIPSYERLGNTQYIEIVSTEHGRGNYYSYARKII